MSDDVWLLGVSMTKFMRYKDRDLIDLGAEAAMAALDDAGVTIFDMGVMASGCLYEANAGVGQRIQKQIGQTGIPVYNVANACATGATALRTVLMADQGRRGGHGPGRRGRADGQDGHARRRPTGPRRTGTSSSPSGRYGAVMGTEGVLGTNLMPGVFAQAGMEYAYEHDGVGFEQFAKVAEKNHAHSVLNPLAQYQKRFSLDEVMGAEMIAYPNTVLMCCPTGDGAAAAVVVSGEKLKTLTPEQQRRAVKISASVMTSDPYVDGGQVQSDVNTLTRMRRRQGLRAGGRRTRRTSTSSSCTTASPPPSCATTTTCGCASPAAPASGSTSGARGVTARSPST